MRVVADEIEGAMYVDLVISLAEWYKLRDGEMVHNMAVENGQRIYLGIRLDDRMEQDDEFWWENEEDF